MDKKGLLKKAVKAAMFTAAPGLAIPMKGKSMSNGMKDAAAVAAAGAAKAAKFAAIPGAVVGMKIKKAIPGMKGLLKKAVKSAKFAAIPGAAIGAGVAKAGVKAAAGVAKKVSSMRQGANANLSPAMAAKRIMTDKKALKKMYPGIPEKGN